MPPYSPKPVSSLLEEEFISPSIPKEVNEYIGPKKNWRNLWCYFGNGNIKWFNVFFIASIHLYSVYSICWFIKNGWSNIILFNWAYTIFSGFGVTGGAHRFYSHKCFKANLPLRIILMLGFTSMGQNSLFHWVRDHRVHHKFSDTDADPHNASRGFFFSHCGWLMVPKNPQVVKQGKKIDMSDVLEDPVVQFHEKYFYPLMLTLTHLVPILVPWCFWNFDFWPCFNASIVRWVYAMNITWLVNSAAHLWGTRPYDKCILPAENKWVSFVGFGEGWHNYHHTFPWDYKAAELSWWLNTTGILLNFFAAIGWAYDLKTPSKELVEKVIRRSGDGTHCKWGHEVSQTEGLKILNQKIS